MAEGYHDFTAGEVLTAANLEDYCELQGIMRFADATARDAALTAGIRTEGMFAYLKDVDALSRYTGSAWENYYLSGWQSYTPTWDGTTGNGTLTGAYQRIGRTITGRITLTWGSTTSYAGSSMAFALPVATHTALDIGFPIGQVVAFDQSAAKYYAYPALKSADTNENIIPITINLSFGYVVFFTATSPFTWTTSDSIAITFCYEAAS